MFTGMPSPLSARVARRPAAPNGILTVTCSCRARSARPSAIIWSGSAETTSAETGPLTSSQMRTIASPGSPSSFASRLGLVVAPERTPQAATSSTSATDPVSMKSLMQKPFRVGLGEQTGVCPLHPTLLLAAQVLGEAQVAGELELPPQGGADLQVVGHGADVVDAQQVRARVHPVADCGQRPRQPL